MQRSWDVIVAGAGAAGLWAAANAARRGRRTLLLEKSRKTGVKILMSGGTRCNLTHDTTWRGIADAFGHRQGRFLKFALASLPPGEVVREFRDWGVATKVEDTGKVFPCSDRAITVRDALLQRARHSGVRILNPLPVRHVEKSATGFSVQTDDGPFDCQSLILTTGGQSYPGCGTTGDGYAWLQQLGHTIVTPRPALTPLRITEAWVRDLAGVTIPDTGLQLHVHNGPVSRRDAERLGCRGSFLFTHQGCSGPAAMNLSRGVTDPRYNSAKSLICDWLPAMDEEALRSRLASQKEQAGGRQVGNFLGLLLPRSLALAICQQAAVDYGKPLAEVSRHDRSRLMEQLKRCRLPVAGTLGFAKAEVTAGGVALDEVDPRTMASRLIHGLYLAGEILDVDGPIGGYNFQAAFSTGALAGDQA
jgi:predicted Rossmann fold flavoprotein